MAKRALIEHRPWLLASLIAATAYYFIADDRIGELYLTLVKGAAVAFLAVYALRRTVGLDGMILAALLVLASAGDMAIIHDPEMRVAGALFLASHLVAITLYLRNRRDSTSPSQRMLALALLVAAPLVSYLLSQRWDIALYAVSLGVMAAAAWMSRFPRYRVGVGAVLFLISDWLIFSEEGPLDLGVIPDLLIWPLYYGGQLMIATGVVQTLRGERPAR